MRPTIEEVLERLCLEGVARISTSNNWHLSNGRVWCWGMKIDLHDPSSISVLKEALHHCQEGNQCRECPFLLRTSKKCRLEFRRTGTSWVSYLAMER